MVFSGLVYGMEELALPQDDDLVISTGVCENFGLVLFDAVLCGTPVMVSEDCNAGRNLSENNTIGG